MYTRMSFWSLASLLACLAVVTSTATADVIVPIPNGDFSLPTLAAGGYHEGVPDSWTYATNGAGSTLYTVDNQGHDGVNVYTELLNYDAGAVSYLYPSNIGANVLGAGYTYTLQFDYSGSQGASPIYMSAWILSNSGATTIASQAYSVSGDDAWHHAMVSGVTTADMTGPLNIQFHTHMTNTNQTIITKFANVQLSYTAPVPEPGAMALVVSGIFGVICYAWRKRR